MKATEMIEQMKELVADSPCELVYFDPDNNRFVYISKEKAAKEEYYVFRLGSDVFVIADEIEVYNTATEEGLKLFVGVTEALAAIIFVTQWRVRGE